MSYGVCRLLSQVYAFGYRVTNNNINASFASDLLHRFFHVSAISDNIVDHYSHGEFADCLAFAKTNSTFAIRNSDSLQYFALDTYAYDVANQGIGCPGKTNEETTPLSATLSSPATSYTSATAPTTQAPMQTTGTSRECHTHINDVEHCS